MARPRKTTKAPQLTAGQASYVLDRLIADRRVSAGEVNRYVGEMRREISELEQRLEQLRQASGGGSSAGPRRRPGRPPAQGRDVSSGEPAKRGRRRRRSAITPEQLASRQLQGRYLGLIRQIPASRRAQYQKTAKERGREAAIKDMMAALKK